MEYLTSMIDPESVRNFLGEAAGSQFTRTLAIFGFAAMVHARQVRKEIKAQFGVLVSVLQQDLDTNKKLLGELGRRVDKIELHFKIKE